MPPFPSTETRVQEPTRVPIKESFSCSRSASSERRLDEHSENGTASKSPAVSADGDHLSFSTAASVDVYFADLTDLTVLEVTSTSMSSGSTPTLSRDGSAVSFHMVADLTGANPDLNSEVFLYDVVADTIVQVTNTVGPFGQNNTVVAPDGSFIIFQSIQVLAGPLNPDGNLELYRWNRGNDTIDRLTDGPERSLNPSVSTDGSMISFSSESDFLGTNPDLNFEIFTMDLATLAMQQVTNTSACTSFTLTPGQSFGASGTRLVFSTTCDLDGQNPGGDQRTVVADLDAATF